VHSLFELPLFVGAPASTEVAKKIIRECSRHCSLAHDARGADEAGVTVRLARPVAQLPYVSATGVALTHRGRHGGLDVDTGTG